MVRLPASLSLLLLATACVEDVSSPGICPDYCPASRISIVDTIITASVERDSSYRGYLTPYHAETMQLTTGGVVESHGIIRYLQFDDEVFLDTARAEERPVVSIDSFEVHLVFDARSPGTGDFELVFHRLPATIDSSTTYADLQTTFTDSTELASVLVTSEASADSLTAVLPGDAFPTLEEDSLVAALGISMRSAQPGFVNLPTRNESIEHLRIYRYVQVDSADGELAARSDTTFVDFDNFVFSELSPAGPTAVAVGGAPAARAFLHMALPSSIVDSSSVVRATLMLLPSEPVVGAPGDTIRVLAEALAADIGPKSPIVQVVTDSIELYSGLATIGSTDTLHIDVTHIIAPWKDNPGAARALMLRSVWEGGSVAEFRFNSSEHDAASPILHITYVPPAVFGN